MVDGVLLEELLVSEARCFGGCEWLFEKEKVESRVELVAQVEASHDRTLMVGSLDS